VVYANLRWYHIAVYKILGSSYYCVVLECNLLFIQKGGVEYLKKEAADVYGLQEVKCSHGDLPKVHTYVCSVHVLYLSV